MSEVKARSSTLTVDNGEEWRTAIAKAFLPMTAESLPSTGFFGRIDAIDTDDFSIARVTSMPQNINRTALACRRTPTDMIKVLIQRRGSHRLDQGESRTSAAAGSLTAYNTDVPYALTLPQEFCADVIMVPRSRLKFVENAIDDVHKRPLTLEYGTAALLSQHIDQLMTRTDEIPTDSAIRMANLAIDMLAVVLGDVANADRPPGVLLDTVQFWIRRHLADETLDPSTIAGANGISVRHLHRLFARADLTVSTYVRRERLLNIRRDLLDPFLDRHTIGSIGARWGLADQAHLSRLFREEFGQSPRSTRNAAQADNN